MRVYSAPPAPARRGSGRPLKVLLLADKMSEPPATFTPGNEPYLGGPHLKAFDDLIIASMDVARLTSDATRSPDLTDLQRAAIQIVPQGFSLALSVRELIRQSYLFGSLTLLRPLAERSFTILYLRLNSDALSLWTAGWHYRKRPTLARMIEEIGGHKFPGVGREMTSKLNSVTHGDPDAAKWNIAFNTDGDALAPMGKVLTRPDLAESVSLDAATYLSMLVSETCTVFPKERRC